MVKKKKKTEEHKKAEKLVDLWRKKGLMKRRSVKKVKKRLEEVFK